MTTSTVPVIVAAGAAANRRSTPLRPHREGIWLSVVVIAAAIAAPIAAVTAAIHVDGRTEPVAMLGVVVVASTVVLGWRVHHVSLQLSAESAELRGLLFTHRVAAASVASAAVLRLWDPGNLHSTLQLFLLDEHGRALLRLRGRFWSEQQLAQVARHFGVPIESEEEPTTIAELRHAHPARLEWTERHPVLATAGAATVGLLVALDIASAATFAVSTW